MRSAALGSGAGGSATRLVATGGGTALGAGAAEGGTALGAGAAGAAGWRRGLGVGLLARVGAAAVDGAVGWAVATPAVCINTSDTSKQRVGGFTDGFLPQKPPMPLCRYKIAQTRVSA